MELFDVVDENDNIIKTGLREDELHVNNDITRVVTIYIYDREGKFRISQRVATKKVDPLKFEAPAHGRVSSGEEYLEAAKREIKEELGVEPYSILEVAKFKTKFDTNIGIRQHRDALYIAFVKDEIKYNREEINSIKEFDSYEEYREYYSNHLEEFSDAIKFGINELDKFFSSKENRRKVELELEKRS